MKVRNILILLTMLLAGNSLAVAQPQYDLRFVVTGNDRADSGNVDIKLQLKSGGNDFTLGSSNFVFGYDTSVIALPQVLDIHNFSDTPYHAISVTEPLPGTVSTNIYLTIPGQGVLLTGAFVDVVSIRFRIVDASRIATLSWRTGDPNAIIVYQGDEATPVEAGNLQGLDILLPIEADDADILTEYRLMQNYPNPFNPETVIRYQLPEAGLTKLVVYNVLGKKVRTLVSGKKTAGVYQVTWDGTSSHGESVASGIYFYRLAVNDYVSHRKMILLR